MWIRPLLIVLMLTACSVPVEEEGPAVPPQPSESRPEPREPRAEPMGEITIDSVQTGNPIVVTGRARTFENNVAIRLRDAAGDRVVETFTTSVGEMGRHNPYRAELWVTSDPGPRITVEALEYSAKDGAERSLVAAVRDYEVAPIDAVLYFGDVNCTAVTPFTRRMPRSISLARLHVEALIAGPTDQERSRGAVGPFPRGARVRSINLSRGVLTVDFDASLQNVGGACRAGMIRSAVNETLRLLPGVERVVITAGGSEELALQP